MPAAALLVGQQKELFKDLFREVLTEMGIISTSTFIQPETAPETFNKIECSKVTGYAVNTINRMICDKTIPYYKMNSRVLFKRDEIKEWMLKNRIATSAEFIAEKELQLNRKGSKK